MTQERAYPAVDPWAEVKQHDKCEAWVERMWNTKNVRFLVEELALLGREVSRDMVKCVGGSQAVTLSGQGGYLWKDIPEAGLYHRDVAISQKDVRSLFSVGSSIRHELIHAYDDARAEVDPSNCLHHACSEIRAARLSGECGIGEEMLRGKPVMGDGGVLTVGEQCVQRRAILSVSHNPSCSRLASHAVTSVWDKCLADNSPYHKYPLDVIFQ